MNRLNYVEFSRINPEDFKDLLNKEKIREHLVKHDLFDSSTIKEWIRTKVEMDSINGCRVRGIVSNHHLAGWCGIQLEKGNYEIAIVLDRKFWGLGLTVFREIMLWARDLGHDEVYIHFLDTRPEYKFLRKISKNVFTSELYGRNYTTYQISVNPNATN